MFENLWFHNVSGGVEIEHCRKMGSCVYKTLLHLADLFEDYKLLVAVRNFYARTLVLFSFVFFLHNQSLILCSLHLSDLLLPYYTSPFLFVFVFCFHELVAYSFV